MLAESSSIKVMVFALPSATNLCRIFIRNFSEAQNNHNCGMAINELQRINNPAYCRFLVVLSKVSGGANDTRVYLDEARRRDKIWRRYSDAGLVFNINFSACHRPERNGRRRRDGGVGGRHGGARRPAGCDPDAG